MDIPEVRYARSGDVSIAYQVLGDALMDLVYGAFAKRIRSEDHRWAPTYEERERGWEADVTAPVRH